jgi:hypothetical protein
MTADDGAANLPLSLTVCQTDVSGNCLATPTASVAATLAANAYGSFGVFVTTTGSVPFLPGVNRIFVRFTDSGGVIRGQTSVAVRTE